MTIKHMPSGLFPHFDSALERRPFYVRGGDTVKFGCRLDGSKAESVKMVITDDAGTREIEGVFHSVNDRGQRYFQFFLAPNDLFSKTANLPIYFFSAATQGMV